MRPLSLRPMLFAVAVLSALALRAPAAPDKEPAKEPPPKGADEAPKAGALPLHDLTQEKLRKAAADAVKAGRADAARGAFWKELDGLVELDPDKILYEHDKGTPLNVTWDARPTHPLSDADRAKAQEDMHKVFDHILFGEGLGGGAEPPAGGLLSKEDAKKVLDVTHLNVAAAGPEPTKPPVGAPPTPAAGDADEIARLRHELDETRQQLDKLRRDVEAKRDKEVDEKRQKELEETRAQIEKLRGDLDDLRKLGDKREKDLDAARAEADKRLKELDETRLQIEKLRLNLDDLRKLGDKHDKDLDDLRREEERRQKELDGARAEAERRVKELEETHVRVEKLRLDLEVIVRQGEKRDLVLDVLRLQGERQRRELDAARAEGERRQRELEDARYQTELLRRQLEATRRHVDRIQKRLDTPKKYVMVVQPSSMTYYDFCSCCWVSGPASVYYYPVDDTDSAAAPEEPLPAPPPALPPPVRPEGVRPPEPIMPPPGPQSNRGETGDRPADADRLFWVGYRDYWRGDFDKAQVNFDGAIRMDGRDARFWYYKALTERALGDFARADESARRGRELHAADRSKADRVSAALERVQGADRRFLNTPEIVVVPDATAAR